MSSENNIPKKRGSRAWRALSWCWNKAKQGIRYCKTKKEQANAWLNKKLSPLIEPLSDWASRKPKRAMVAAIVVGFFAAVAIAAPAPGVGFLGTATLGIIAKTYGLTKDKRRAARASTKTTNLIQSDGDRIVTPLQSQQIAVVKEKEVSTEKRKPGKWEEKEKSKREAKSSLVEKPR